MSYFECDEPICDQQHCKESVQLEIIPKSVDLGGFTVSRVLPSAKIQMMGPFIFWDQMGPGEFLQGQGLDVRPHPHIGLATMTYLFSGSMHHRDSLGSDQVIYPGDVNLMTAGKGIVHSERTPQQARLAPSELFGIQCWLALPDRKEDVNPDFQHYAKAAMPEYSDSSVHFHIAAGQFQKQHSPVKTYSDALFVDMTLKVNEQIQIDLCAEERAIYILTGSVSVNHVQYKAGRMLILSEKAVVDILACENTHFILLGGTKFTSPRFIWWNFVSSSKERIQQAGLDWQNGLFPNVPGDENEFTPLPP